VALGSSAFVLAHPDRLGAWHNNRLLRPQAHELLAFIAGAVLVLVVAYAGALSLSRRSTQTMNSLLRPVLALPLLEALRAASIEHDKPGRTLLLVALVALVAGVSTHTLLGLVPRADPPPAPDRAGGRLAAAVFVGSLWAAYAAFFAHLSIQNHHALNTRTVSLAFYDNIFYQSAHGHPLACSFMKAGYHGSAHFDPILVAWSPLYLLHPGAEAILTLQSFWLGAGVVPVYLLGRTRLEGRVEAAALAVMYALYPALHGANLYEFHSLTLAAPIVLWALWFFERERWRGYAIAMAAALLVREDVSILLAFVGIYGIASGAPGKARAGWLTILASAAYFAFVKRWCMTSSDVFMTGKDAYGYAFNYEDLIPNHDGASGMLTSLVTNPVYVLETIATTPKLLYVAELFLPLAFLPVLARPGRVMLVWGLLFGLLATRPALHSIYAHYPCTIIPVAFAITPSALQQIRGSFGASAPFEGTRVGRSLLAAALVASVLCSWKFGGFVENASFRAGYLPVARSLSPEEQERYAWVREQADRIPSDASVGVTNRIGPHCSSRKTALLYPEHVDVEWLFVDENELHGAELEAHRERVRTGLFELVASRGGLAVYRRKVP
jgi:uncharacterized membrane protein